MSEKEQLESQLSPEITEHVARLAHIEITPEETELFTKQLNSILNHFKKLAEVDVSDVEVTNHPMDITNVFRPDEPKESLSQEEALNNAPKKEKGYIIAPRIV